MKNTQKSICLAYFADGKFIGWYSDTSGSVTKDKPKLYTNSESQLEIIKSNLTRKLAKINSTTFAAAKEASDGSFAETFRLLSFSSEELLRGKAIELRIVECPEYDGENPDFDNAKYEQAYENWKQRAISAGVFGSPSIYAYEIIDPAPKCNNWIYTDYGKVKEWAANEPTEFIGTIVPAQ